MAKDTPWDKNLSVTCDGEGLAGHADAVLLRKLAGRCGLTAALGAALTRAGKFPQIHRGVALVSMAVAIVLGAASMSDIALLAHQALVFGAPPSSSSPSPGSTATTSPAGSSPSTPASAADSKSPSSTGPR